MLYYFKTYILETIYPSQYEEESASDTERENKATTWTHYANSVLSIQYFHLPRVLRPQGSGPFYLTILSMVRITKNMIP